MIAKIIYLGLIGTVLINAPTVNGSPTKKLSLDAPEIIKSIEAALPESEGDGFQRAARQKRLFRPVYNLVNSLFNGTRKVGDHIGEGILEQGIAGHRVASSGINMVRSGVDTVKDVVMAPLNVAGEFVKGLIEEPATELAKPVTELVKLVPAVTVSPIVDELFKTVLDLLKAEQEKL